MCLWIHQDTILTPRSGSGDTWSINKRYTKTKDIYKDILKDIYIKAAQKDIQRYVKAIHSDVTVHRI